MIAQLQRLRHDVCLVLLAPNPALRSPSGLHLELAQTPVVCYGRVLRTGPACVDVAPRDVVCFPPSAGDAYTYKDFELLLVRERDMLFACEGTRDS